MRYEELPGPLEGWTYDEDGTIYTASGYRCDARHIEAALWLFSCFSIEARRFLIHSDEAADALRPVYELSDLSARVPPTRLRIASTRHGNRQRAENCGRCSEGSDGRHGTSTAAPLNSPLRRSAKASFARSSG